MERPAAIAPTRTASDLASTSLPGMTTLHLTDAQHAQLEHLASLVGGSPHNLVSRRARGELMTRHVPEAARLAARLPAVTGPLLDVGSGGGFPGLVIAIVRPDIEVHLLDATRKKADFLAEAATELGREVWVHHGRAEELARGPLRGAYEAVTARAVAPLRELIGLTMPFARPSGVVYAVKGERWRQEVDEARSALHRSHAAVLATPEEVDCPRIAGLPGDSPRVVMLGWSP